MMSVHVTKEVVYRTGLAVCMCVRARARVCVIKLYRVQITGTFFLRRSVELKLPSELND
jgi:hypothetical protein